MTPGAALLLGSLAAAIGSVACVVGAQPWVAPGLRLLYRAEASASRAGIRFLVARQENEIELTRGDDASPTYDAAEGWIVYSSRENGSWDLWRVRLSGEDRTPMTRTPGINERFPVFTREGDVLFFTSDSGGTDQVWRSARDGTDALPLTSGPAAHSRAAPDSAGTRLAAVEGEPGEGRLVWIDAATGAVTPVEGAGPPLGRPAVRRDGALAYPCVGKGGSDLCVLPVGEEPRRIAESPAEEREPAWSLDGSRLAFSSNREDADFELYVVRPDGSDLVRLTNQRGADLDPSWVP